MRALAFILSFLIIQSLSAQTFDELLSKGDAFYEAANYSEAIKFFTLAIEKDKKNVKGYWYRADAYRQNLQYKEAVEDYSSALVLEPANIKFLTRRGDCYYSLNEYASALKDYTKGIELDAANATLWLYRGDCYAKLNETENACSDYQKAFSLGDKSAKGQAKDLACEWIKSLLPKPCPTGEAEISKVEVDEFTGAVIVSRGLSYQDFQIKTENGDYSITGPEFALGESIVFKITNPANFCLNEDEEALIGTGFSLLDDKGKELGGAPNIYEGGQGLQQEYLKSMSITLDFEAPMEVGKNYTLKIRYFDSGGNGEVTVLLPFKIALRTQNSASTFSSQSVLGSGVYSASVEIEPKSIEVKQKGKTIVIRPTGLIKNTTYAYALIANKRLPPNLNLTLRFVNDEGKVISEKILKPIIEASKVKFELSTVGLAPDFYRLWIRLNEPDSLQCLGVVIPVTVK
jgi:tetratricopeptide (TPR) repeat protein